MFNFFKKDKKEIVEEDKQVDRILWDEERDIMYNAQDLIKEYPIDYIYVGYCNKYKEKTVFESCGEVEYEHQRWDFFLAKEPLFDNFSSSQGVLKKLSGRNVGELCSYEKKGGEILVIAKKEGQDVVYKIDFCDGLRYKNTKIDFLGRSISIDEMFIKGEELITASDRESAGYKKAERAKARAQKLAQQKTEEILATEFGDDE